MDIQVVTLPPTPIIMLSHSGAYDAIGPKFEKLWEYVSANGIPAQKTLGIYWDNPEFTPVDELRSAACVQVPLGYTPPANFASSGLQLGNLAPGDYAMATVTGSYDQLSAAWGNLVAHAEGAMGRAISDNPAFEVYVNDPAETAPNNLITELYLPLK